MDVCAQKSAAVLKDPANQVEAMELLSTPNFSGAMQDAVTQFWNTPNMSADTFVEKVVSRHARRELRHGSSSRCPANLAPPGLGSSRRACPMATVSIRPLVPPAPRHGHTPPHHQTRAARGSGAPADRSLSCVVYIGCMLWTVRLSFTSFDAPAEARLGRLCASTADCSSTTAS